MNAKLDGFKSNAPEHWSGVSDVELDSIVSEFNQFHSSMYEGEEQVHHLFDAPQKNEIVKLQAKAGIKEVNTGGGRAFVCDSWMTIEEAKEVVNSWKDHAHDQYEGHRSENSRKIVLSLFDYTGAWSQPWVDAGYTVFKFDIQEDSIIGDVNNFSVEFFMDYFGDFDGLDVYAILAACPCTDFASSGSRHFAAKDADGRTVQSVELVHQTLRTIEYFRPAIWAIENPVGRIEKLGGLPPWRLAFHPNHLGDPYTKKTILWGRFNADLPIAPVDPVEGSKMHKLYGGSSLKTKNARSETPEGFSYGFFMANNAVDNPLLAIAGKYDRLDKEILNQALEAGLSEDDINDVVEDYYFMELDNETANNELLKAIAEKISQEQEHIVSIHFPESLLDSEKVIDFSQANNIDDALSLWKSIEGGEILLNRYGEIAGRAAGPTFQSLRYSSMLAIDPLIEHEGTTYGLNLMSLVDGDPDVLLKLNNLNKELPCIYDIDEITIPDLDEDNIYRLTM